MASTTRPHDDCWRAYEWTHEHSHELGTDAERLAVGGAFAGGNLAGSVALRGRDAGMAPWQALLAYPVMHARLPAASAELAGCISQTPRVLTFVDIVDGMNENYLVAELSSATPYAFPGDADDLVGYAPTYIESSEFHDLRSSVEEFSSQLEQAGADVQITMARGVPHGYLNAVGSPLATQSLDRFASRIGLV